ncbi:MAG: response regulator transcription factor [Epsilonproteobacteria bacterium]|nr:response regulator transcription factor [Campylobacterota bacterium]
MYSKIFKDITILFAEDEKRLAKLMRLAIEDYFGKFIMASNGEEALNKYHKIRPDIIITDIMMPKVNGLELAREIKSIDEDLPIIILSAYSHTDMLLQAIDIGVTKYFIKPFNPDELLQYLATLIPKIRNNKTVDLIDDFKFNVKNKKLYQNETEVSLTKREVNFFSLLMEKEDYEVDNKTIKNVLWIDNQVSNDRLRTFIKRLRDKTSKKLIENISSQGYKLKTI